MQFVRRAAVALAATLLLTACMAPAKPASPGEFPPAWLEKTQKAWPSSDGKKRGMPVLESGSCLIQGKGVTINGVHDPAPLDVGFGPLDSDEGYLYLCSLFERDRLSAQVQLFHLAADIDREGFLDGYTTPHTYGGVRQVSTETLSVEGWEVLAVREAIPSNPGAGVVRCAVLDGTKANALALIVNSMSPEKADAYPNQRCAEDLVGVIAAGR